MPIQAEIRAESPSGRRTALHEHDFEAWIERLSRRDGGTPRLDLHGGSRHEVRPPGGGHVTQLRGSPWPGASVLYLDMRLRRDLRVQLQPGEELLITLFLSGKTAGRVGDGCGRRLDFRPGRALLRTPNRCGGYLIEMPRDCRNRFVHFRLQRSRLPAWLHALGVRLPAQLLEELMQRDDGHILFNAPPTPRVSECLNRIGEHPEDPPAFASLFHARATELLTSVLLDIGTLMKPFRSATAGGDGAARRTAARVRTLVMDAPARKWNVDMLARRIGCSGSCLQQHVRQATGNSVHRLLVDLRLELAARLLRETDLYVQAIAAEVGWECHGRFAAAFRGAHGATPRAYRLHHRQADAPEGAATARGPSPRSAAGQARRGRA